MTPHNSSKHEFKMDKYCFIDLINIYSNYNSLIANILIANIAFFFGCGIKILRNDNNGSQSPLRNS